jgi:hypothetical protein
MLIKNDNTLRQHCKIINAIAEYGAATGAYSNAKFFFGEMESYDETLYRLFDWSCKKIVPAYIYETIKPYLE